MGKSDRIGRIKRAFDELADEIEFGRLMLSTDVAGLIMSAVDTIRSLRNPTTSGKRYRLIYADPPWSYRDKKLNRGGCERHYKTASIPEIMGHIESLADPAGCVLACWHTWPGFFEQTDALRACGWKFRTKGFTWGKTYEKTGELAWGMGSWTRANDEPLLLYTRGKDWPRVVDHGILSLRLSPRLKHSEKPAEFREDLERLFGDVSRVEMYAREVVDGWDQWGNEV